MFIKTVISSGLLILAVGFSFSYASAASIDHHHEGNSHGLTLSKLNDKSSQHFCPVKGKIMEGSMCEMGLAPLNDKESSDIQEEYFIATECGGHHHGAGMAVFQIDHKVTETVMSNSNVTPPSFAFSYLQLVDYSQGYLNSPYKPPKFFS